MESGLKNHTGPKLVDIANNFQEKYNLASFYQQPTHEKFDKDENIIEDKIENDSDNKENIQPIEMFAMNGLENMENTTAYFHPFDPARYRYQMRKPVESWKYAEIRKSDGTLCYQCRVCASGYKHKKSLNKHWRDKHYSVPRPEGAAPDEDDEDDDDSSEIDAPRTSSASESFGNPNSPHETTPAPTFQPSPRLTFPQISNRPMGRQSMVSHHTPASLTSLRGGLISLKREPSPIQPTNFLMSELTADRMIPEEVSSHQHTNVNQVQHKRRHSCVPGSNLIPENFINKELSSTVSSFANFQNLFSSIFQQKQHKLSSLTGHKFQEQSINGLQPLDLTMPPTDQINARQNQPVIKASETETLPQQSNVSKFDLSLLKILLTSVLNALDNEENASSVADLSPSTMNLLQAIGSLLSLVCNKSTASLEAPVSVKNLELPKTQIPVTKSLDVQQFLNSFPSPPMINQNIPQVQQSSAFNVVTTPKRSFYRHSISHSGRRIMTQNLSNSLMPTNQIDVNINKENIAPKSFSTERFAPGSSSHGRKSLPFESNSSPQAGEPVGPIGCKLCPFEARWFSELRAHMVNHSEHRMFGCCYCIYRAKWKWDVAKHMRRCALARHVAHLPNESLLRMVKYLPPPASDILYEFFPKHSYPGVGTERPVTPPQYSRSSSSHTTQPLKATEQFQDWRPLNKDPGTSEGSLGSSRPESSDLEEQAGFEANVIKLESSPERHSPTRSEEFDQTLKNQVQDIN